MGLIRGKLKLTRGVLVMWFINDLVALMVVVSAAFVGDPCALGFVVRDDDLFGLTVEGKMRIV